MSSQNSQGYTISSTPVKYPYKAYPSQIGMIDRVIKSLQRNQNCLIESPTGSGKSLALLCAVLAWRQNEYEKVEREIRQQAETQNAVIRNAAYAQTSNQQPQKQSIIDLTNDDDSFSNWDDGARFIDPSEMRSPTKNRNNSPTVQANAEKCQPRPLTEDEIQDRIWEARKRIPRIFFGTRTHKQLAQLIRELKKTQYADVKMTILASRDQTCINQEVRSQKDRSDACRQKLNPNTPEYAMTGGCSFHAKWKKQYQKPQFLRGLIRQVQHGGTNRGVENVSGAWDIEDLVQLGTNIGFCPYFAASNTLLMDAELVFCPYNYLIDPVVRTSVRLDLKGQIILLDEAHNIEDVCRDASSFAFTRTELRDAADVFLFAGELDNYPPAPSARYLEKIASRLLKWLEEAITSTKTKISSSHTEQTREFQGLEFMQELTKLGLEKASVEEIRKHLEIIGEYESEENSDFNRRSRPNDEEKSGISSAAMKTMEKLAWFLTYFYASTEFDEYRICVKQEQLVQTSKRITGTFQSTARYPEATQQHALTLHLWCMNPATAFRDIGESARSVILASGTLAPMKTFETELGADFKLQLEATHVLPKDRMFVASVAKGPSGRPLRVTYQHTQELGFQDEVGQLIIDVCTMVPFGVLCFFPSYKLLETMRDRWSNTGALERLSTRKLIVVEPKMGEELQYAMDQFYEAVKHPSAHGSECTGALFLAVCRGKVSEGLDFADDNARAVITIGIPYPNFNGFEVIQKRDYNNKRVQQGKSTLNGDQWYEIQAYRALNQALGRCLRHRQDWGALILVDERFGTGAQRYCSNLSRWIRENIRHYNDFGRMRVDLDTFTKRLLGSQQETVASNLPLVGKRPVAIATRFRARPTAPAPSSSGSLTIPSAPAPLPSTPDFGTRYNQMTSFPPYHTPSPNNPTTAPLVQARPAAFTYRKNDQSNPTRSPYFKSGNEETSTSS